MERIDLNCDLGEGCGSDAQLMRFITSANIACCGHAGDAETMRRTVELALENGVAIGAHPGYEDRENFGRVAQWLTFEELRSMILRQVEPFRRIVETAGAAVVHIKPHGALYNQAAADPEIAAAIASVIAELDKNLMLVGLSESFSITAGKKAGLRTAREAFGDRRYDANGRLVPRSSGKGLITDADSAAMQVLDIVRYGRVKSIEGTMVKVPADTICVHGDGPNAVEMAMKINRALTEAGIAIARLDG